MQKNIFLNKLQKNIATNILCLMFFLITMFLTGACAGSNQQTSINEGPKPSKIVGDQTIECRRRATTGSRFKRKICKTKSQWAREDHSKQETAEQLQKDAERNSRLSVSPASGTFPGAAVPR